MDPRMKKNNISKSGSDIPSPVLLRRRLSAPETVMRKYKLARAKSQENDTDSNTDSKFGNLSCNLHGGSEMNLQKKKDTTAMMRKSTLLRRLMNNPKTFGSSSFQEWQHYCGKLSTPSLNSLQGSPEHMSKSYSRRSLIGYEYKTSPKHTLGSKKVSPVHQLYEPHNKNPVNPVSMSPKRRIENHSFQIKSTKPKEPTISSSRGFSVSDHSYSKHNFAGHSDSAYCYDKYNFTPTSVSSCCSSNSTNVTTQESTIDKNGSLRNNSDNMGQGNVDENRNFSVNASMNYVTQETSTQTNSSTNLNVISNVKLSQKTLDLIVSEVMKDVQKSCTNGNDIEDKTGSSIHVQKICGIYAKSNGTIIERPNESLKCLADDRLHARGRNSSRISLISSRSSIGDKSDNLEDQSDITSLADSLEETSSGRFSFKKYDEKPVRGDLPPIPVSRKKLINAKPPDVFFVPIKTDSADHKPVSDYLPEKLKEKILRRQKNRQDKFNHCKESLNFVTENIDKSSKSDSELRHIKNRVRFRKHLLPSIELFRKSQKSAKKGNQEEKSDTKKTRRKTKDNLHNLKKTRSGSHHNESHEDFHLYKSENDYLYEEGPKRIYHKAEFRNNNRRIEILEIMECVDLREKSKEITTKTKSKIPVLRDQNLAKTTFNPFLMKKATYLELSDVLRGNTSLDQLITDILIQPKSKNTDGSAEIKTKNSSFVKQEDYSEGVSEEIMQEASNEVDNASLITVIEKTNESAGQVSELSNDKNNSETKRVLTTETPFFDNKHSRKETAKEFKDTQTITDDCVVFYPFQNKEGLIDTTSNEGRNPMYEMKNRKLDGEEEFNLSADAWGRYRSKQGQDKCERSDFNGKNDFHERILLPPPMAKRYSKSSRRPKYRTALNENPTRGEWSITLSGTNNASIASDLEMKIRFPSSQRNNHVPFNGESHEWRENNKFYGDYRFSKTNNKDINNLDTGIYNGNNRRLRNLPGINNNLRDPVNRRVSDPVAALRAMDIADIRPRQTKTSLKRYNLTRPKLHPLFESNIDNCNIDRKAESSSRSSEHQWIFS
ncbi:uncharacterized protein LOC123322040 isoform X2 [Coccinella septempunctata]|uniref:uncharacterized protein LOC123322040 isoform X2 n=1 Tax=Coccinella septempunctata TaxID=41139 RepID=UPI001D0902B9|nr:uncharacterized protein LOC123322040 isoform X2 [Coccinella septempunctata]